MLLSRLNNFVLMFYDILANLQYNFILFFFSVITSAKIYFEEGEITKVYHYFLCKKMSYYFVSSMCSVIKSIQIFSSLFICYYIQTIFFSAEIMNERNKHRCYVRHHNQIKNIQTILKKYQVRR